MLLSRSGLGLERLLICTVQQMNELQNGTAIGGVAPRKVNHYERFRRVARLLRELQEDGFIQITTLSNQSDQVAITAGPFAMDEPARQKAAEILSWLNVSRKVPGTEESPNPGRQTHVAVQRATGAVQDPTGAVQGPTCAIQRPTSAGQRGGAH